MVDTLLAVKTCENRKYRSDPKNEEVKINYHPTTAKDLGKRVWEQVLSSNLALKVLIDEYAEILVPLWEQTVSKN